MLFHRKIGLKERSLLQESVNTMYIGGIVRLIRKILFGTIVIELIGAALLSIRFIPMLGAGRGIYTSIFTSVSAFCNAGFDLMGRFSPSSSLTGYNDNPIVMITIMLLIIIGGIGFYVWNDVYEHKFSFRKYSLHTKIVLTATFVLIFGGAIVFFCIEGNRLFRVI